MRVQADVSICIRLFIASEEVYTPAIQADSTQDPKDAGYSSFFSFVTLKRENEVLENAIMLFKKPNKSISKTK